MPATYYVSRSAIETRQRCPRQRFLRYHYDGKGIEPKKETLPKLRGKEVHNGFAALVSGQPIDKAVSLMRESYLESVAARGVELVDDQNHFVTEQLHLAECVLRGWAKIRLPLLLEDYEHVLAEQEWDYEVAPGIVIPIRMDWIVRHTGTGQLAIIDYKTAGSLSSDWQLKWEKDLQTEIYVKALTEKLPNESIMGIIYEGLEVGSWKVESGFKSPFNGKRIQQSPYCYGYRKFSDGGYVTQAKYSSALGWEKFFVPEMYSAEEWTLRLYQEGKLENLFCHVPPIHPAPTEMESIMHQITDQELQWKKNLEIYRDLADRLEREKFLDFFAPQHLHECLKFGIDNKCSFWQSVCFNEGVDPLDNSFIYREDHHKREEVFG